MATSAREPVTRFGLQINSFTYPGVPDGELFERIAQIAGTAERSGFDSIWVMDHLYQIPVVGKRTEPMLEAYSLLCAVAARTTHAQLGTMVTGVTYRNPALLAKMVTTLDVISKGRAILGIGAAWNEDEHAGYGYDFPPIARRMDRLDEAATIAKLMFTEERPSFEGRFYRIDRALNVPRPIQEGGPKILIGGGGEKRTLRILATHGDIGHWFGGALEDLKRKKAVFEEHCAAVGRNPSDVMIILGVGLVIAEDDAKAKAIMDALPAERRAMIRVVSSLDEAAEYLRPFLDAGFGGFTLNNPTLPTIEAIGRAGELIKTLRGSSVPA